jgi:hypothetical protein
MEKQRKQQTSIFLERGLIPIYLVIVFSFVFAIIGLLDDNSANNMRAWGALFFSILLIGLIIGGAMIWRLSRLHGTLVTGTVATITSKQAMKHPNGGESWLVQGTYEITRGGRVIRRELFVNGLWAGNLQQGSTLSILIFPLQRPWFFTVMSPEWVDDVHQKSKERA